MKKSKLIIAIIIISILSIVFLFFIINSVLAINDNYHWTKNVTINSSLPDIGAYSAPTIFKINNQWHMIAGETNGRFKGFTWNGTGWKKNATINASLPDVGSRVIPSAFQIGSLTHLIAGTSDGKFKGFTWNGTGWKKNATINASLPDIGFNSAPTIFKINSQHNLISGINDGKFKGFTWNGTGWKKNATINASLPDIGSFSTPNVFQMGSKHYLISGIGNGRFQGFTWNGTGWKKNATINASLPSVMYSTPTIFNTSLTKYHLISGIEGGTFLGYSNILDIISPTYSPSIYGNPNKGLFFINVSDNSKLIPRGQYIFSTNATGSWVNETVVNFTGEGIDVIASKIVSIGTKFGYKWYFWDNARNFNSTSIYTSEILSPIDLNEAIVYLNLIGKRRGFNLIWEEDYSGSYDEFGGTVVEEGVIYTVAKYNTGYIHAINSSTGFPIWTTSIGQSDGTPLIDNQGDFIYINLYDMGNLNGIYKLNKSNGIVLDINNLCIEGIDLVGYSGSTQSLTQSGDLVFMGCKDGYMYAHNKTNLDIVWSYNSGSGLSLSSTPLYWEDTVTYGTVGGTNNFIQLNATNGSLIWTNTNFGNAWDMQPSIKNGIVYMGSYGATGGGVIAAFNFSTGVEIWNRTDINLFTQSAIYNNKVWVGGDQNILYSLNLDDGTTNCSYSVGGDIFQGPSISKGFVFFGSLDNWIYTLNSTDCSLIWKYQSEDKIYNPPAISKGDLFFKDDNYSLYKFNLGSGTGDWKYIGYNNSGMSYCENCLTSVKGVIVNCSSSSFNSYTCSVNNSYNANITTTLILPSNLSLNWYNSSGSLLSTNTNCTLNLTSLSYQDIFLIGGMWNINSTINASLPNIGGESSPSVFNTSLTRFNLISGSSGGKFKGFTWNGTGWKKNATINASLPDIGSGASPSVFKIGSQYHIISGAYDGKFKGFTWNGTGWKKNATINASLPDTGDESIPCVFKIGSLTHLIAGTSDGKFKGFTWNGTGWKKNATINASLPDIGSYSAPSIFRINLRYYFLSGKDDGRIKGFTWNGTGWTKNATINASIPTIGRETIPNVFLMNSHTHLIFGIQGGSFHGFTLLSNNLDINLTSPTNNTYTSDITLNLTTKASDENGIKNITLKIYNSSGNLINITTVNFAAGILTKTLGVFHTFAQGIYKWFTKVFDWNGNSDISTNYTLTIDTTNPIITISTPSNGTYSKDTGLDIKYIYTETNCKNVTWQDGVGSNTTLASCGTNITTPTWGQGKHNITVFMRDKANNLGKAYVSFIIDTVKPILNITSPTNKSYVTTTIVFNVTVTDINPKSTCRYSFNGGTKNYTMTNNSATKWGGINSTMTQNHKTVTIFCNDSADNINSTTRQFTVDTIYPKIAYDTETATNYANLSQDSIYVNVTLTETNFGNITYNLYNRSIYTNGLVGWWALDDNQASQIDYSVKRKNGTVSGATYNSTGKLGGDYIFDGTNDYIDLTNSFWAGVFPSSGVDFTISVWIYPKKVGSVNDSIIATQFGNNIALVRGSNNMVYFSMDDTRYASTSARTTVLADNKWYHLVVVHRNASQKANTTIYVNGLLNDSRLSWDGNGMDGSVTALYIGWQSRSDTQALASYFNGSVDEVRIYNRSLSQTEITELYNSRLVNKTTYTTVKKTINWTNLDDGNYSYNVYVVDKGNNQNSTLVRRINLDNTNPTATLTVPVNNTNIYDTTQNLTSSLTDAIGIKNATLYIYNNSDGTLDNSTTKSFGANIISKTLGIMHTFADGIYTWFYKVYDWASNSALSNNYTITIDNVFPHINFVNLTPNNNSYVQSSVSITANITDNLESNTSSWIDFDNDLVGYWSMDSYNSTGIYDNSSYGEFGVFNGGLGAGDLVEGMRGQALEFDGSNDYIRNITINIRTSANNQENTLSLWFKSNDTSSGPLIMFGDNGVSSNQADQAIGWISGTGNIATSTYNSITLSHIVYNSSKSYRDNNWHLLTSVLNDTSLSLYVDGIYLGQNTGVKASNAQIYATNPYVLIGTRAKDSGVSIDNVQWFNGSIDEVMIFNRSLSADEIKALYDSKSNEFNVSFSSLSEGQHNYTIYAIDEAGNLNKSTRTFFTDLTKPIITFLSPTPVNNSNITYNPTITLNITDNSERNTSSWIDFDNSLKGYWSMDYSNSTDIFDNSSYDYFGTFKNGLSKSNLVQGVRGKALQFDGSNDYLSLTASSNLIQSTNHQFTVALWLYPLEIGSSTYAQRAFSIFDSGSSVFLIGLDNSSKAFYYANSGAIRKQFSQSVSLNKWVFLAVSYNGTAGQRYFNGNADGTPTIQTISAGTAGTAFISCSAAVDQCFNGSIDEVMIFNRSLSSDEIAALYNSKLNNSNNTFSSLSEGNHTYKIYTIDEAGNLNTSTRELFVDNLLPDINLTTPTNNTFTNNLSVNLTTEASDETGIKNITFNIYNLTSGSLLNTTTFNFASSTLIKTMGVIHVFTDGVYKWFTKVFDWAGNSDVSTNYTLTIDTLYPKISIVAPSNNTNTTNTGLDITYRYTEINCDNVTWNDNNGLNTTLANCGTNITLPTWNQGKHNLTIFIRDMANNLNKTYVSFIIDSVSPKIAYDTETAVDYANLSQHSIYVNVTLTELNFKNISYTLRNKTSVLNVTNFTTNRKYLNFSKGIRDDNYTYYVNVTDIFNNKNSTSIRHILLDTITPNMTISNTNNTLEPAGDLTVKINYTATDTHLKSCYFTLRNSAGVVHNYAENTSLNCSAISRSINALYFGTFVVQFWAEDYAGNLDDANFTFRTYSEGGGGGGGGGQLSTLKANLSVELKVHYYNNGLEYIMDSINQYNLSNLTYDAFSIDIVGKNKGNYNLDLVILNLTPEEFNKSVPRKLESLKVDEEKVLWASELMLVKNFTQNETYDFFVNIKGKNGLIKVYANDTITISINKVVKENLFNKIGEFMWETNPLAGILTVAFISIGGLYIYRKNKLKAQRKGEKYE